MKSTVLKFSDLADAVISDLASRHGLAKPEVMQAIIEHFADNCEEEEPITICIIKRAEQIRKNSGKRTWKR